MTEVTAVVASYRSAAFLPACLESLAAQTRPPAEVVVVDGSSPDDSVAVARRHGARVLERANRGLGWLYNEGARASETELLLLANADVAFAPGCLEALAGALAADPTLFAADARQLDWAGGRTLHARTAIRRGPLLRTAIPGLAVDPAAPPHRGPPVPTAWANAGAMLVRRARLLALGGFDERFFLDFEDVDLCWRAWLRGWPSVHVPEAVVRHAVSGSTSPATLRRRLVSSHANLCRLALKCFPPAAAARVVLAEVLRLARAPALVAPALGRVLVELPGLLRERRALRPSRELFDRLTAP